MLHKCGKYKRGDAFLRCSILSGSGPPSPGTLLASGSKYIFGMDRSVTSSKLVFALLSSLQVLSLCGVPTERYTSVSLVLGPCHLILSSFRVHIRVPAYVICGMSAKFEMQLSADTPLSCPGLCMVCMMHARKGTRFLSSYW
jgi:hypothetical protein